MKRKPIKVMKLARPIIGKRTGLAQAFDQFLSATHLPINEWASRQVAKKWRSSDTRGAAGQRVNNNNNNNYVNRNQ